METQHDHSHDHGSSMGSFNGPPKTMFMFGFIAGVALCTTLGMLFVVWSVASGKGLSFGSNGGSQQVAAVPTVPSAPTAPTAPTPGAPVKPVDEKADHIIGAKNAKVTLIEYSDFECPFCKTHFNTMEQALKDYPNDVRLVYRHYPLSFHQNAQKEAEASECVGELGGNDAFWKFYHQVFTETTSNGTGFALDKLGPAAKNAGVDQDKFQKCLDSGKYAGKVAQQEQEGADAGVNGTPGTFVNGKLVEGAVPYAQFKSQIDAILKK